MGTRLELHEELKNLRGSSHHVYFQPPETLKMTYPAIVYKFDGLYTRSANDKKYVKENRYIVTFIHKDPDEKYSDDMFGAFPMCSYDRRIVVDNLYNDVYTLYY
jgi:hypothetical protein